MSRDVNMIRDIRRRDGPDAVCIEPGGAAPAPPGLPANVYGETTGLDLNAMDVSSSMRKP